VPALFKFANPIRFDKKAKIGQIRGVDMYVHWTGFLVAAVILAGVLRRPGLTLLGLAAYWSMLLIHEMGHLIAAQRLGCPMFSIELYPIFGITRFGTPWSRLDHCKIAWAGVLAQAVVAAPLVGWVAVFGYTRFESLNMLFVILGFFSLGTAVLNLLPTPPLDGATAWGIFPALLAQRRSRRTTRPDTVE
jgi:Zn-dependent protease